MAEEPISLYFQLKPGEKADLEVVAAAAIAWVESLRAAAQAIDPDADIRVELVDAEEGSLNLNALLEWFEKHVERRLEGFARGGKRLPRTRKLAISLASFVVVTAIPTYEVYFGDSFDAHDRKEIDELLAIARKDEAVRAAQRKFYRAVEREPAITGVGVKESPTAQPMAVVPSSQFAEGGGLWEPRDAEVDTRTTYNVVDVVLVRPTLTHTPRVWTFKVEGLPEFDAVMRDPQVLAAIGEGHYIDMREGIPMTIRLQVREVLVDGQWRLERGGRSVVKVLSPLPR
jgi:hypothetical protein